jgi:hypothetical protein
MLLASFFFFFFVFCQRKPSVNYVGRTSQSLVGLFFPFLYNNVSESEGFGSREGVVGVWVVAGREDDAIDRRPPGRLSSARGKKIGVHSEAGKAER